MADSLENLAQRLKHARKLRGLSQKFMAQSLGVAQQTYADWESGDIRQPKHLKELSDLLKVSYDWLKHGQGEMDNTETPFMRIMRSVDTPEIQNKLIAAYELFRGAKVD